MMTAGVAATAFAPTPARETSPTAVAALIRRERDVTLEEIALTFQAREKGMRRVTVVVQEEHVTKIVWYDRAPQPSFNLFEIDCDKMVRYLPEKRGLPTQ